MIKDFNSWKEYEGLSEGSGRSEKIWLINPKTDEIGLFKFRKTEHTTEHLSEKIAMEIARLIDIKCMKVDIGEYKGRLGSLSYRINKENENVIEGVRLINNYYPNYNPEVLYDYAIGEYYSLEMILRSLQDYEFQMEFLGIPIFDFLIGNTDRHQNNWAILQGVDNTTLCPLYDNGSSLCCYLKDSKIDSYLGNDKVKFNSLIDSKSTSRIKIDKKMKKEPTHLEVVKFLYQNYYEYVIDIMTRIVYNINEKNIDEILMTYNGLMGEERIILIKRFLEGKVKLLLKILKT